jgi:NAD(P)-dependent dehydrogenase (short-subunit alcohol dehydrogenase family)
MSAVVITGAAGDLGRALAASFLADGHTVFGADIAPIEPRAGLIPVELDVTDRAALFALAERAAAEAGALSLWINGAGIVRVARVLDADPGDWDKILAVNLTGTFHGCAAALAVMSRQRFGRIVNIGSLSGQVGGTGVHPAYGASKAGVHALTKTYALEGARYGVYCNAVAPSVIDGAMGGQFSDRQREQLAQSNPQRRLARMDEVVGAIRYLASDTASYTNGVILPVNGGSYLP